MNSFFQIENSIDRVPNVFASAHQSLKESSYLPYLSTCSLVGDRIALSLNQDIVLQLMLSMSGQTLLTNSWMLSIKTQRSSGLILPSLCVNSPLPTFSSISGKSLFSRGDNETLILVLSSNLMTYGQRLDLFREAFISLARIPRVTTGRIWRKSPENRIVHSPIGEFLLRKSRIVLFSASTDVLFDMVDGSFVPDY